MRRSLSVSLAAAMVGSLVFSSVANAAGTVTRGPSYVPVPASPFAVGNPFDAIAVNPSGGGFFAADYLDGTIDAFAFDPNIDTATAVSGSPFASGKGPDSVTVNAAGSLVAAPNLVDDTVGVFSVSAPGVLTPVPGSPFATGNEPRAAAFNAAGNLLAVVNSSDDTVSVFSVGPSGTLTAAPGSPFGTGAEPVALSFSPNGNLLAVANESDGSVSVFTVDGTTGSLTPSAGSPLEVGDGPAALAFNPSGSLLAVADALSSTLSIFSSGPAAANFVQVPGSPVATGSDPLSIAFNSTGGLLATANFEGSSVGLFDVNAAGTLTLAQGAPFVNNGGPRTVAFLPDSTLFAVGNGTAGTVSVFEPMPPPTVAIDVPGANQKYPKGTRVRSKFVCDESDVGPGIASCRDARGADSGAVLDTKTQGRHKYTVNAVSADGLTATATVTYLVAPPVPVAISRPKLTGAAVVGRVLSCSQGVWRGHPYRYTYQWNRGNTPLAGAIHFRYRVTKLDEGSQLTCSVTASNGSVGDATSSALSPLLSASPSCPAPSGNLTAKQLATIKLGDTRVQANAALPDVRQSTARNSERFCLSPAGITIGFPGGKVAQLMRNDPQPGQVIWAMTANPSYNYDGITAGIALMTAEQRLGTGTVEQQGQTTFYLARTRASTVVVAARGQVVREIGIADHQATATPALIKALVATLPG